jgi:hypothetical protein
MADTARAKKLLEEVLRYLPQENAYSSTKIHVKRAISELFHVEQKRVRHTPAQWPNWQMHPETGEIMSPAELARQQKGVKNSLSMLDEMYAKEEQKLANMDKQTRHNEEDDENNVGPIFG